MLRAFESVTGALFTGRIAREARCGPYPAVIVEIAGQAHYSGEAKFLLEPDTRKRRGNRLWQRPELRIPFGAVETTRREILDAIEAGTERHGRI